MVRSPPSQFSNFNVGWRDTNLGRLRPRCTTCEVHTSGPQKTVAVKVELRSANLLATADDKRGASHSDVRKS